MAKVSIPPYPLPAGYESPHESWKRPERRERGDDHDSSLFLAIGKALSRWEILETFLGEMFAILVESDSRAAARAYGTAASTRARYQMLEAAAPMYFDDRRTRPHDATVMNKLVQHYNNAAYLRNDIAHGIVTEITAGRLGSLGHFLVPPDYNTLRTKPISKIDRLMGFGFGIGANFHVARNRAYLERATYAYTSEGVTEITAKFEELAVVVAHFRHNLLAVREHGPDSY